MEILCNVFLWFFYSTLAASAVALLVMAIQKLFYRHLSARLQHALWLIVLLRLLLPDFPSSPASIFNIAAHIKNAVSMIHVEGNIPSNEISRNSEKNKIPQHDLSMLSENNHDQPEAIGLQEEKQALHSSQVHYPLGVQIAATIWFAGAVTFITYLCSYLFRMRKRRKTLTPVTDQRILSIMDECQRKFGIKKTIPLYTGDYVKSPCISGLIHPWIFVPEAVARELSSTQLLHVLSHELAHCKRKDMWWNTLGSYVLAIHWMNPIMWICMKRMKADREIACDACVLEVLGEREAAPYGLTMIDFLKRFASKSGQPQLLYFWGTTNKNEMTRRITMIKAFKKGSYKFSALAIVCVAGLGVATLTNAAAPAPASSSASVAQAGEERLLFASSSRTYGDLEKAVKVSPTPFKVPDLPELSLDSVTLDLEDQKLTKASISFKKYGRGYSYNLVVIPTGVDYEDALWDNQQSSEIKNETLNIKGMNILKLTRVSDSLSGYYWEEQGLQYKLWGWDISQEALQVISSMKFPDKDMLKRYKTNLAKARGKASVYDTEDLRSVQDALGFAPKLPMQPLGIFKAAEAEFYYRDTDRTSKSFFITYDRTNKPEEWKTSFYFDQRKDTSIYQEIKKTGTYRYEILRPEYNNVKTTPLQIEGKEVFKTEKYKRDGRFSSADEVGHISYFWIENDMCYQATFLEDISQQQEIVAELIKAKPVDVDQLK
ncbi:M56 family metallopeptidase [Brevibacillus borstelensis]|uniref:M56 family metallopeptidase n=1 Tax=Brevibacillus borstelensis TaxID=45462 RepID=UPI0030C09E38